MIDIRIEDSKFVAYIAANGREACIDKDPLTSLPFETEELLRDYAETIEAAYTVMKPPAQEEPLPPEGREWHPYDFWLRFNPAEQAALIEASRTDANIENFRMHLMMTPVVRSDDEVTINGMNYLVTASLLTETRKNEILGGE